MKRDKLPKEYTPKEIESIKIKFKLNKDIYCIQDQFGYTWIKLFGDYDDLELRALEAALDHTTGVDLELNISENQIHIHYLGTTLNYSIEVVSLQELLAQCNDIQKVGKIRDYVISEFCKEYNWC